MEKEDIVWSILIGGLVVWSTVVLFRIFRTGPLPDIFFQIWVVVVIEVVGCSIAFIFRGLKKCGE